MKPSRRSASAALPALLLALVTACSPGATAPTEVWEPSFIAGFQQGDPRIEVPATVERGVPFRVEITTYGNGCVRKGETWIQASSATTLLTPHDIGLRYGTCTDILQTFTHEVTLRFDEPGPRRITVRGRDLARETVSVQRDVIVE